MEIVDDSKLKQLAAEPRRSLFATLDRASAMTPLLALIAFVPGLYALHYRTLDENVTQWGLKGLAISTSSSLIEIVDPGKTDPSIPLKWQPPLGTWLTAACFRLVGGARPVAPFLVSYLSTAGLIGVSFVLASRLGGPRLGLLVALLLSVDKEILHTVQTLAPLSLGLLLALVTLWGYLGHIEESTAAVSYRLLLSGIGLGLCILAAGPLALVVFCVLLIDACANHGRKSDVKQTQPRRRWIFRRLGSGLPSVCVIGLTAFAVGGWWVMMMASRYGTAFCQVWYGGIPETPDSQLLEIVPNSGTLAVWSPLVICLTTMGWLAGLSVYGFWQTCAKSLRARKEAAPRPWRFSVLWAITALAYVSILSSSTQDAVTSHGLLWGFVAIPLTILAAAPIEDMIARRSSRNTVCGLILATALSGIWSLAGNELVRIPWSTTWTSVLLVAVLGSVAGWWIIGFRLKSPASRRYVLRGLILFVLAAHGLTGLAAVRQANEDDGALDSLRRRLVGMGEVDRCTLITLNPRRQRLHYLMQSIWPHAIVDFATNWEAALESSTRPTELRDGPERHLVLTWGEFDRPLTDPANPELKITQATSPQYMGGEPIRAFMVLRRPFHAPSP